MNIEELKKKAEAATPGPWKNYDVCVRSVDLYHTLITAGIHCDMETANRDAAYIAAANPQTVLTLIEEITDLRQRLEVDQRHTYDGIDCRDITIRELERDKEELKKELEEARKDAERPAWESTTPAYTKYITDSRYRKLKPAYQKWYRPICQCAARQQQGE